MAAGYNAQCRACTSPRRGEIDQRLLKGESTRSISAWLQTEHGESIPFQGLANHKGAHLDVQSEVKQRLAEAETRPAPSKPAESEAPALVPPATVEAFENAVASTVARADRLDELADMAFETAKALHPTMLGGKASQAAVSLYTRSLKEAREATVAKHELLEGKKVDVGALAIGPVILVPPESDD